MDHKLLQILACPLCKGKLLYDSREQELLCRIDRLAYAIEGNIPVMIPEQARRMQDNE